MMDSNLRLNWGEVARYVTDWIAEARALPTLGMLCSCFTLLFDGGPLLVEFTDIFNVLIRQSIE